MFDKAFVIANGTTLFYQWDIGQKIIVGVDCQEVHCTNDGVKSLPSTVYEENGQKVARIDDIFFQEAKPLTVYGYVKGANEEYTLVQHTFQVRSKPKPITYAYTPTETKTWDDLYERIDGLGIINLYVCSDGEYVADGSPMIAEPDKNTTYLVPQDNKGILYASWVYDNGVWKFIETLTVTLDETEGGNGTPGINGLSAYEIAVKNGYKGSEADWLKSLQGEDGKDGKDGITYRVDTGYYIYGNEKKHEVHFVNPTNNTLVARYEIVDGVDGKDGSDGNDGYTPIKGVDYFDGADGKDGKDGQNGKDGYTPVKGVDYFDGKDGSDGKTPIKGTDYFTDADKAEMVNAVKAALPIYDGEAVAV